MNTGLSTNKKKSDIIYNRLRAYIDENKFSANLRLPSENALCRQFQVSRDTVRLAMARLVEEKIVIRVKGSGSYINKATALSSRVGLQNSCLKIGLILGQDSNANSV